MADLSLNFLKAPAYKANAEKQGYIADKSVSLREEYVFKDLSLDLTIDTVYATKRHQIKEAYKTLKTLSDLECIVTSVQNILHTTRGQKILNPYLGLDLSSLLFQPVNLYTGQTIAQLIAEELSIQEPRVLINNVHCVGFPEENQYTVDITCTIPSVNNLELIMNGLITANGIKINKIDNESIG